MGARRAPARRARAPRCPRAPRRPARAAAPRRSGSSTTCSEVSSSSAGPSSSPRPARRRSRAPRSASGCEERHSAARHMSSLRASSSRHASRRRGGQLGEPRRGLGQHRAVGGGHLDDAQERARRLVGGVVGRGGADHAPALGADPEREVARVSQPPPSSAPVATRGSLSSPASASPWVTMSPGSTTMPGARLARGGGDRAAGRRRRPARPPRGRRRPRAPAASNGGPGEHADVGDAEPFELAEQPAEQRAVLPREQRGGTPVGGGRARDHHRGGDGRGVAHGRPRRAHRRPRSDGRRVGGHAAGQGRGA